MSVGEKMYLAMVMMMFVSFIVLMGTLCWLDGKDARIQRRREKAARVAAKPASFIAGTAGAHR